MNRTRFEVCDTAKDFNNVLKIAKDTSKVVLGDYFQLKRDNNATTLSGRSYLKVGQVNLEITTISGVSAYDKEKGLKGKPCPCTYVFRLDGGSKIVTRGSDCYKVAQRYYKIPDLRNDRVIRKVLGYDEVEMKFKASCGPLIGYNPKFDRTEHNVWIYDLNSAYAVQLMQQLPDTSKYKRYAVVGENQVGFNIEANEIKMCKTKGITCEFVFDLIESPYKKFARKYYDIKRNAPKGSREREKAKQMLNLTVGMWQRFNPFLRAYIVLNCNEYIKRLLDDNSTMWNTDAIYSTVERPELTIGTDIGEWKLEYQGLFRQVGCNYQKVAANETSIRGVPKSWFKDGWNILTDELPTDQSNIYYLDTNTFTVKRRKSNV